jgi:hypothetical protein
MKARLVLSLALLAVSTTVCTTAQAQSAATAKAPAPYDMLEWMTMGPELSDAHHMTGTANPVYTHREANRFFWTKTPQGYPWDVQLFDDKYIYLWVTELSWTDMRSYKVFHSSAKGNFNMPISPRFVRAGYPGATITVSDSTYEIHSSCDQFVTKNLGYVVNQVWGPYQETLGGELADNLTTMVISYRYTCDADYDNCQNKEEYHLAKPYGLVKWQHESLLPNGTYGPPDKVTIFNRVVAGQTRPVTSCF